MKLIVKFVKKTVMAFLVLYGINMILSGVNFYIPINIITVGVLSLLGIPGMLGLVAVMFIV